MVGSLAAAPGKVNLPLAGSALPGVVDGHGLALGVQLLGALSQEAAELTFQQGGFHPAALCLRHPALDALQDFAQVEGYPRQERVAAADSTVGPAGVHLCQAFGK
ncbi:MAG TPA: hypothetical protein PLQ52_11440, partial [Lacunisphaera sp.]|nr:hypothetical protein [Lacunisphaera sp.]